MQEAGVDPSQYASSQIVATSKPRELGSTGPDTSKAGIADKLAAKATAQALGQAPVAASNGNATSNGNSHH